MGVDGFRDEFERDMKDSRGIVEQIDDLLPQALALQMRIGEMRRDTTDKVAHAFDGGPAFTDSVSDPNVLSGEQRQLITVAATICAEIYELRRALSPFVRYAVELLDFIAHIRRGVEPEFHKPYDRIAKQLVDLEEGFPAPISYHGIKLTVEQMEVIVAYVLEETKFTREEAERYLAQQQQQ